MGLFLVSWAGLLVFLAYTEHERFANQAWLLMVGAVTIALAGLQLITAVKGRLSALMGGLVCAGLSCLGFCAAFTHEQLRGSLIPFLPAAWDQAIGHVMFGFGALIPAAMALYLFVRAIKLGEKK